MKKPTITMAPDEHRNREIVSLHFEKDFVLIGKVKSNPGVAWSQSRRYWNKQELPGKERNTTTRIYTSVCKTINRQMPKVLDDI